MSSRDTPRAKTWKRLNTATITRRKSSLKSLTPRSKESNWLSKRLANAIPRRGRRILNNSSICPSSENSIRAGTSTRCTSKKYGEQFRLNKLLLQCRCITGVTMSNQTIAGVTSTFWKTRQELQKYQLETLRGLVRHVWHRSRFYRELYSSHGIRESDIDGICAQDLPFVTKRTLTDNFDSAVTDSRLKKESLETWIKEGHGPAEDFLGEFIIVHSSGTSGYRAFFPCDRPGYQVMTALVAEHLAPPKRERKTKIAIYRGLHGNYGSVVSGGRLPKSVHDVLLLSLLDPTQRIIDQLNIFQPDRLDGHASSIALLARHAREGRLRISPEEIIVSGDALTGSMKRTIKAAWDVPLSVLYTCSESFCLALGKPSDGNEMTVFDDLNILEILDDDNQPVGPGGRGRIVITN